jgi:hypothetical protein
MLVGREPFVPPAPGNEWNMDPVMVTVNSSAPDPPGHTLES